VRNIVWIEFDVPGEGANLGALLLPGDAGLGGVGEPDLTIEMRRVLELVEIQAEQWKLLEGIAPGVSLALPLMGGTPGDKNESDAPWQVARGTGFTVGIPPGFRARRMDGGVPPPSEIPGGLLWLRGRFEDMEGIAVAVGDERRAGYIADIDPLRKDWVAGKTPPLGAPDAKLAGKQPFGVAAERTKALSATAERWEEPGFSGDWMLFRLVFKERGVEIGLPVLEGRRSASLYWIAATWRPSNRPPAPPPVDPAERFGIRFERLRPSEKSRLPWVEGYLNAPGFRAELPKGWVPAASLRSRDGYPIRIMDRTGITKGLITRVSADQVQSLLSSAEGWQQKQKPGAHRAQEVHFTAEKSYVFVAKQGYAFLVEPVGEAGPDEDELWRLLISSVQLLKVAP
jgi:hypothetical protein